MAQEVKDIQQLINQRADAKLEKAIDDLYRYIDNGENYQLLKEISVNAGTPEKPKMICVTTIFGNNWLKDKIIENNRERYRSKETADFMEKVESLRQDVDTLLNSQEY